MRPIQSVAVVVLIACSLATTSPGLALALPAGKPAPDFEFKSPAGVRGTLSSLRGKAVLVDFWASWCEPCKKELPLLATLARKLAPQGVEIILVNIDEVRANADAFLKSVKVTLPIHFDPDGKDVAARYEPPTMPTSFLVDAAGVIRHVNAGFELGDEKELERQLLGAGKP